MWRKSLKSSAIYSTKSKIENLKITVTLKTISSLLKLEKFNLKKHNYSALQSNKGLSSRINSARELPDINSSDGEDSNKIETIASNEFNRSDDSIEIIELEWQQKVFSRYEIEYYKDIQNCITDLQKEYHEWIIRDNLSVNNEEHNKIFTYVDSDNFFPAESDDSFPQRKTEKETTLRAQKYSHPYTKSKVMYIYADLNPDTLLFMLRWLETENMLIVYPDFNEFNHNPYFIEIDTDYRHLYSYAVQNVSISFQTIISPTSLIFSSTTTELAAPSTIPHNTDRNEKKHQKINKLKYQLNASIPTAGLELQNNISSLYDMPPKKSIRVNFLFNIKEAQNFEYDSLHVRYYIKLPNTNSIKINTITNTTSTTRLNKESGKLLTIPDIKLESGNLNGATHSSQYKWVEEYIENTNCQRIGRTIKMWNFSYPFQLSLLLREQEFQNYENSLKICFELISIDSWKRERTEGLSFLLIPIKPGIGNYNINCYRPDYGFIDRIERFFIGGRKIFNFENFNSCDNLDGFLNRFHTKCISTGILNFHSECIFQRNPNEIDLYGENEIRKKSNSGMTLDDIMKAYQEARKRLEATTLIYCQNRDETEI